jgi:hypothetical protein
MSGPHCGHDGSVVCHCLPNPEDDKALAAAKTKLQILLNPDEADTVALLGAIDQIDKSKGDQEFSKNSEKMVVIARRLLKREWVRIRSCQPAVGQRCGRG